MQYFSHHDRLNSPSILSSRFIHTGACDRISFPFETDFHSSVWKDYILFIHSSIDGYLSMDSTFWLWWTMLLLTWVCKYLFKTLLSIFFTIKPEVRFGIIRDFYRAPLVFTGSLSGLDTQQNHKCGPTPSPYSIANQDPVGWGWDTWGCHWGGFALLSPI